MSDIPLDELQKNEYLNQEVLTNKLDNRVVPAFPYKDANNEWCLMLPIEDKLVKLKAAPSESEYIASDGDDDNDVYLPFIDFLFKHTNWKDVSGRISGLIDDFNNICTVVSKLNTFYELLKKIDIN